MGAVVAATYALNDNWYDELVEMDTSGFPATPDFRLPGLIARLRGLRIALLAARDMYFGWGFGARTETWGRGVLSSLTKGKIWRMAAFRYSFVQRTCCQANA